MTKIPNSKELKVILMYTVYDQIELSLVERMLAYVSSTFLKGIIFVIISHTFCFSKSSSFTHFKIDFCLQQNWTFLVRRVSSWMIEDGGVYTSNLEIIHLISNLVCVLGVTRKIANVSLSFCKEISIVWVNHN